MDKRRGSRPLVGREGKNLQASEMQRQQRNGMAVMASGNRSQTLAPSWPSYKVRT